MQEEKENGFNRRARAVLERMSASLDAATLAELRARRARALAAARAQPRYTTRRPWSRWPALGAMGAAALALGVGVVLWLERPPAPSMPLAQLEDLEILAANESTEFYAELEFYRWLASQQDAG